MPPIVGWVRPSNPALCHGRPYHCSTAKDVTTPLAARAEPPGQAARVLALYEPSVWPALWGLEPRLPPAATYTSSYGTTTPNATFCVTDVVGLFHPPACDHRGSCCTLTLANDDSATVEASGHSKESATVPALANVSALSVPEHMPMPEALSTPPHAIVPPL